MKKSEAGQVRCEAEWNQNKTGMRQAKAERREMKPESNEMKWSGTNQDETNWSRTMPKWNGILHYEILTKIRTPPEKTERTQNKEKWI